MMMTMVAGLLIAAQSPAAGDTPAPNPHANELFDRDPALRDWAVRLFDRNGDGWLTLYEAQPALARFRSLADLDRDGRVTVKEYGEAKALIGRPQVETATVVVVR